MAKADPEQMPLMLRPELVAEVTRLSAWCRSPEGRAEIAAEIAALKAAPSEPGLPEAWESIADTAGWTWTGEPQTEIG